jgi:peptide chain release factor subunit 1
MLLNDTLDRLAGFEATTFPVISLYLNTQADHHGKRNVEPALRRELQSRAGTWEPSSAERQSFEQDCERILEYVRTKLSPAARALVVFACGAADLWEVLELEVPIEETRVYVYDQPHLYGLARLNDQYPLYAALITDTNYARLFVFGLNRVLQKQEVENVKTRGTSMGGWSQARYQRHIENYHLQHVKEIVDALDKVVREDRINHVIISGDEVVVPKIKDQLPQHVSEKVIDIVRMDVAAPEHEVLKKTLESLRRQDAKDDVERVQRLLDEFRAGGLAVAGPTKTLAALTIGQVDELLLSANLDQFSSEEEETVEIDETQLAAAAMGQNTRKTNGRHTVLLPAELVTKAAQTSARVTFIEDPKLLAGVGGVGAILRYRV